MAQSPEAGTYRALPAGIDGDDDRWSVPQTAMFVTVASVGLWALILVGVRWLLG
jgi:hypothetical protein